jgi:hypothetical protein
MNNTKILKARELKKNEALNNIRKIYNPNYKFPYSNTGIYYNYGDEPSCAEEREKAISNIIEQLEIDLRKLKVVNEKPVEKLPLSKHCEYFNSDECDCGKYCSYGQNK